MEKYQEIERSIIKKYRKEIWSKFVKAIQEYQLIEDNDKIMVCISGGKDSFLLAKCFQELERHGKQNFTVEYVSMDPGYNKVNRDLIEANAKLLNIPIKVFESDIFDVANTIAGENPCYMCARMRRGYLYTMKRIRFLRGTERIIFSIPEPVRRCLSLSDTGLSRGKVYWRRTDYSGECRQPPSHTGPDRAGGQR